MSKETRFYTYMWLRKDGTPYYVGKGSGSRAFKSWGRRQKFEAPPVPERIVLRYYETESEAFEAEKLLIKTYGRKDNGTGILRNLTDGGEGPTGHKVSEEERQQRAERIKGAFNPMRNSLIAKRNGEARRGLKRTDETKKLLSKTFRQLWAEGKHLPSPTSFQPGDKPWNKNKVNMPWSGKPTWNKGLTYSLDLTPEQRAKRSEVTRNVPTEVRAAAARRGHDTRRRNQATATNL